MNTSNKRIFANGRGIDKGKDLKEIKNYFKILSRYPRRMSHMFIIKQSFLVTTAHLDITKVVFNANWYEFIAGRATIHIVSAIVRII